MAKGKDKRVFLGWDAPVVDKVRDWLVEHVPSAPDEPLDLGDVLVVVPTAQAGRRLREALALHCDERGTALLAARAVTPAFFLRNGDDASGSEATPALTKAIWARLLMEIDLGQYPALFPAEVPNRDYGWALHTSDMFQRLRHSLADAGLRMRDVAGVAGGDLEETDRWTDMGRLEDVYLERVRETNRLDPVLEEIRRARDPVLPDGVERVVIAAVPDPTKLMLDAIKALDAKGVPVEILVHAPNMPNDFDDWGIPVADRWREKSIDIPEFRKRVRIAGTPESQAQLALEAIAECADEIGPADIAVGVPDRSVAPFLESLLSAHDLPAYDPAERAVSDHALFRLLESFCELQMTGSYRAFADLLRHPEMLNFLERRLEVGTRRVLSDLDNFQNTHLPMDFDAVRQQFRDSSYIGPGRGRFEALGAAVLFVRDRLKALTDDVEQGIRGLLAEIYGARGLIGDSPREEELESVADAVDAVLRECAEATRSLGLDRKDAVSLFLRRLSEETYPREREKALLDLEGWLELPWNNAPLVIITGMNEGSVPDSRLGDVFLPDRLRKAAGLPDDSGRFARDVYLLSSMIVSRPEKGRVVLTVGRQSAVGDPLKPSRLLFRCGDEELVARTEHLLGEVGEVRRNFAFNRSFLLDPSAPIVSTPEDLVFKRISATQFGQYLACPFRFYLRNVLGMEELNDEQAGLGPTDFGTMMHWVLEVLGEQEELRSCTDEKVLASALHARLDEWVAARFGDEPPLTVKIAAAAARQRLLHAARVQADEAKSGWVILPGFEERFFTEINGLRVTGRIDRIDRHTGSGTLRVVDYKSGNRGAKPEPSHISKSVKNCLDVAKFSIQQNGKEKEYAWRDLQLPLYSLMAREALAPDTFVHAAYFNMPKAVTTTEIAEWSDMSEELVTAARECAERIIDAIGSREFWPPSDRVTFEDFGNIITGTLGETVDGTAFKAFLDEQA